MNSIKQGNIAIMISLTIKITPGELTKLQQLSKYRKKSPDQCIRDFINSSLPGGTGWKPPEKSHVKKK